MIENCNLQKLSIITTHFFDFDWTTNLIHSLLQKTNSEVIHEIIVINQDRNEESTHRLSALSPLIRVVAYPPSPRHFEWTRHDHAHVLNLAMHEVKGDYIVLFDSDAFPISSNWYGKCCELLQNEYDAILAADMRVEGYAHPCFMVFDSLAAPHLAFDEGLFTPDCIDTGRLIGQQLIGMGRKVHFLIPHPAFGGKYGSLYLGDTIYHHGKGSFAGVDDPLIRAQIHWENSYFKRLVLKGSMRVPYFGIDYYIRRLAHKIKTHTPTKRRG
jgi:hypothetical protein